MAATACSDDCISLSSTICKDKDVAHFKDAAVVDCQYSFILKSHKSNVSNEDIKKKAKTMIKQSTKQSARQSLQEGDEEENEIETTFITKRLTEILDQQMELTSRKSLHVNVKKETNKEGIKLFSSSTCLLNHTDQPYIMPVRKKRTYSTSSNSSEDERLAESVVTCDLIFRESRTCDSKLDVLSNSSSDRPEQQDKLNGLSDRPEQDKLNNGDVITKNKSKKKVKKKKKHKQVKDNDT